jgi:hypothetical protein
MKNLLTKWQEEGLRPYYFGLGFIQLKLNNEERVHFYHPDLPPIVNYEEEIHDHRYHFHSKILKGSLNNRIYLFEADKNGQHLSQKESCDEKIILTDEQKEPVKGNLNLFAEMIYTENQSYYMDFHSLHTVQTEHCITWLKRSNYMQNLATVIRPMEAEKICPFSKKIDEKTCWDIMYQCLKIEN